MPGMTYWGMLLCMIHNIVYSLYMVLHERTHLDLSHLIHLFFATRVCPDYDNVLPPTAVQSQCRSCPPNAGGRCGRIEDGAKYTSIMFWMISRPRKKQVPSYKKEKKSILNFYYTLLYTWYTCIYIYIYLHTFTFQLLDKPWSQEVPSLLPPDSCLQFLSRIDRVQQSHCSSIVHRVLLTHALALSASQFVHKKKSQRIYTVCTRRGSNSRN